MGDFFLNAQTTRVVLSTISIIGSSLIDVMIIKNDGLRKSPYSRIIFGLSFGDIMLSLGLLLGPIVAPKGTKGAIWAIGNVSSCEAIGFVMNMGISGVPFYVAFLAFYFDQRVRHKLSRQAFAKKYEMKCKLCFLSSLDFSSCANSTQTQPISFYSFSTYFDLVVSYYRRHSSYLLELF